MNSDFEFVDLNLDDLQHSMDIKVYLNALLKCRDKYNIIFISKVNSNISDNIFNQLCSIGFDKVLKGPEGIGLAIISRSNVIYNDVLKNNKDLIYENKLNEMSIKLTRYETFIKVRVSEMEYSMPADNMNFFIFECDENKPIDISSFNPQKNNMVIHHRNIEFTEDFFDNNFFVIDEYKEKWRELFRNKYYSNRKLNCTTVINGIVEPIKTINGKSCGGVADDKFNFITGHDNFSGIASQNARYVSESYRIPYNELEKCDETVIFGGIMYDHPGHLIIESIADKMWYAVQEIDQATKIAVLPCWNGREGVFLKQFIDALNIPEDRIIFVRKPTQFKKVIVPDSSERVHIWPNSCEFTKEYVDVFEYMKKVAVPSDNKKIYLTKKKTNLGNIIGEDYFIEFYKNKGFQIVNPEDYTIKEKISLMLGADEVVTPDGTNVLFTVFCNPSVKLTILSRVNNDMNLANFMVLEAAKIKNIKIVDVALGFFHKHFVFGLSLMSVTNQFIEYVNEVYHEKVALTQEDSLKNNLYEYVKYIPEYYSNPFIYNLIKNQKMLTVLQNMSEVFLGKDFDTSKLDLSTNESNLQNQVKDLTAQKNDLTSKIDALTKENEGYKSSKATLEDENKRLNAQLKSISDMNEALKLQLTALENTNKTLMSANSHLAQSVTEISSLLKNNTNSGE